MLVLLQAAAMKGQLREEMQVSAGDKRTSLRAEMVPAMQDHSVGPQDSWCSQARPAAVLAVVAVVPVAAVDTAAAVGQSHWTDRK